MQSSHRCVYYQVWSPALVLTWSLLSRLPHHCSHHDTLQSCPRRQAAPHSCAVAQLELELLIVALCIAFLPVGKASATYRKTVMLLCKVSQSVIGHRVYFFPAVYVLGEGNRRCGDDDDDDDDALDDDWDALKGGELPGGLRRGRRDRREDSGGRVAGTGEVWAWSN